MKGLIEIPNDEDLARAYRVFQTAAPRENTTVAPDQLALWAQWVRFDPRLGEQWIAYVARQWKQIEALRFNEQNRDQPWPAVVGVLLDQAALLQHERPLFRRWAALVLAGISAERSPQQFFIGLRAFAGREMRKDVALSHPLYLKWGYFARDLMVRSPSGTSRHSTLQNFVASVRGGRLGGDGIRVRDAGP